MKDIEVLLTGFESWGPYSKNVSKEVTESLDQTLIETESHIRARINSLILPIDYVHFREILERNLKSLNPSVAVGMGMDFKDLPGLSFEVLAHQIPRYGSAIVDRQKIMGRNYPLDDIPNPLELPNQEAIIPEIHTIPQVEVSENAGRHMCETVLRDLIRMSNNGIIFQPAFLHLPHTPDLLEESVLFEKHSHAMIIETQRDIVLQVLKILISKRI